MKRGGGVAPSCSCILPYVIGKKGIAGYQRRYKTNLAILSALNPNKFRSVAICFWTCPIALVHPTWKLVWWTAKSWSATLHVLSSIHDLLNVRVSCLATIHLCLKGNLRINSCQNKDSKSTLVCLPMSNTSFVWMSSLVKITLVKI